MDGSNYRTEIEPWGSGRTFKIHRASSKSKKYPLVGFQLEKARAILACLDELRAYVADEEARQGGNGGRVHDPLEDVPEDASDEEVSQAFADPGGNSALRAASRRNPRNLPCPNCGAPNRLTPADRARGYQCNACADRDERGGY